MAVGVDISANRSRLIDSLTGRICDSAVLKAMRCVPRENFLNESLLLHAYDDNALPIGFSQTTSQPFVIARMLEMMLSGKKSANVLEIGAGNGYQSALLSLLCERVFCVERIRALADATGRRLVAMGYNNVVMIHGDGLGGHVQGAPYDGIVVCAESADISSSLVAQLSPNGRLVMPLIESNDVRLTVINACGKIIRRCERVNFVPLTGGKA